MPNPKVHVEVAWEDVTQAPGDVHVVGHYRGVLLDRAVSSEKGQEPRHLVITDMTRRGVIRGALGDLNFVPWGKAGIVLVAGMGVPGSFRHVELRKLVAGVVTAVGHLVDRPNMTTVLIGGGAGNLPVSLCVTGLIDGLRDAFEMDPDLRVRRVRIVEFQLDRALEIHEVLKTHATPGARAVDLEYDDSIVEGKGGVIPRTFRYSLLLAAVAKTGGLPEQSETKTLLESLKKALQRPGAPERSEIELQALFNDLQKDASDYKTDEEQHAYRVMRRLALGRFPVGRSQAADAKVVTTRLVFSFQGTHVRSSAITDTVTVRERDVAVSAGLLQEAARRLSRADDSDDSQPSSVAKVGRYVFTLMVHPDIEEQFTKPTDARVIELDQPLAAIPWEMLIAKEGEDKPLGLTTPFARQLRTQYSPRAEDIEERRVQRALVIANPANGPAGKLNCVPEATKVRDLLVAAGIETTLCVGPGNANTKLPENAQRAGFFDTLVLLLQGEFDLVHFCGHATFVPDQPDLIGWLFADNEILAARYLQQMRRPPLLVVANACNSAQLTGLVAKKIGASVPFDPGARAAAGLADEFFRHGIRDYIGTSIEVPSDPATEFATELYAELTAGTSVGEAVRAAREALFKKASAYGAVWGAYQHYGDPTRQVFRDARSGERSPR